uniref:Uncharacterized protein n=1 Tax=Wuchereria bancrofti TaxID=6293 RepID=A0A1I8EVL5_WUCBA
MQLILYFLSISNSDGYVVLYILYCTCSNWFHQSYGNLAVMYNYVTARDSDVRVKYDLCVGNVLCWSDGFIRPGAAAKETAVIWIATIVCGKKKTQHTESDDDNFIQLVRCSLQDALREITTFTGKCVTGSRSLTKSVISVKGVNNITRGHRFGKKPMRALQFHPTRKVLTCADENVFSVFSRFTRNGSFFAKYPFQSTSNHQNLRFDTIL